MRSYVQRATLSNNFFFGGVEALKNGKKLVFGISLISQLVSYIGALVLLLRNKKGAAKFLAFFGAVATVLTLAALEKEGEEPETAQDDIPSVPPVTPCAKEADKVEDATSDTDNNDNIDAAIGILKSTLVDNEEDLMDDMNIEISFGGEAHEDYTTPDELSEEAEKLARLFEEATTEEI